MSIADYRLNTISNYDDPKFLTRHHITTSGAHPSLAMPDDILLESHQVFDGEVFPGAWRSYSPVPLFDFSFSTWLDVHGVTIPPKSNTGGVSECACPLLDYFSGTFKIDDFVLSINETSSHWVNTLDVDDVVHQFASYVCSLIPGSRYVVGSRGRFNYTFGIMILRDNLHIGMILWGANRGTCYLSLSAEGMNYVDPYLFRHLVESLNFKITRVDLAVDDLDGVKSIDYYVKAYESGLFTVTSKPTAKYIDDLGSNAGKTLYVGKKVNGKECCIYEKGKQKGIKDSPWLRSEVRYTNVDRVIPYDIITDPTPYFTGSYPVFKDYSSFCKKIAIVVKIAKTGVEHVLKWLSIGWGPAIHTLKNTFRMTYDQICEIVDREGCPDSLNFDSSLLETHRYPFTSPS